MSSGDLAVQYAKLPEWLLARRAISEDYARLLQLVETKVQQALAEPVADQATKELIERHREAVTYFAARDIYQAIAKTPEGQSKSLLGAHTNPAAAKWRAVFDAYHRRHLGWASEARVLIQNTSYEIPALKKHAAACERQVSDCTQRQSELTRQEEGARARYDALLKEMGIAGLDPRGELLAITAEELPKVWAELSELLLRSGSGLVELYDVFARFVAGDGGDSGATSAALEVLPLLRLLATEGAEAQVEDCEQRVPGLRELRAASLATGSSSSSTARGLCGQASAEASGGAGEIDWGGGGGGGAGGAGGIDWGGGAGGAGSGGGAGGGESIDWGGGCTDSGGGGGGGGGGAGINWDFEVAEGPSGATDGAPDGGAAAAAEIDWGSLEGLDVEVREEGREAAPGAGSGGSSLLAEAAVRELLLQEVVEVSAFLQERRAELAAGQVDTGPPGIEHSLQDVEALSAVAAQAEELLSGRRTQRLVLLQSSQHYLDQTIKRLDIAKAQCHKPVVQRSALDKVKAEQAAEAKRARAEVEELRAATKKAQRELEAELSTHFKSNVRIVGDIATI